MTECKIITINDGKERQLTNLLTGSVPMLSENSDNEQENE